MSPMYTNVPLESLVVREALSLLAANQVVDTGTIAAALQPPLPLVNAHWRRVQNVVVQVAKQRKAVVTWV